MNYVAISLWAINMFLDTLGHLAFKGAAIQGKGLSGLAHWKHMLRRSWLWIGISCYVVEFFVWLAFLSQVSLGTGVMLGCINIVTTMLGGRILFNEKLTNWRLSGMSLITLGVALVGVGG